MSIYAVDKDDRVVVKRTGSERCHWMKLDLDAGQLYRIYCVSVEGTGAEFALRVYTKGSDNARCAFFDWSFHSRMTLVPTPARLKLEHEHTSRAYI
jgi:hypothetical protein